MNALDLAVFHEGVLNHVLILLHWYSEKKNYLLHLPQNAIKAGLFYMFLALRSSNSAFIKNREPT